VDRLTWTVFGLRWRHSRKKRKRLFTSPFKVKDNKLTWRARLPILYIGRPYTIDLLHKYPALNGRAVKEQLPEGKGRRKAQNLRPLRRGLALLKPRGLALGGLRQED